MDGAEAKVQTIVVGPEETTLLTMDLLHHLRHHLLLVP
jgi:hypothetical protein